MSFYADLPPPSSGVDPGKTSASSGWNASQKLSAPPQRKPTIMPLPRSLAAPAKAAAATPIAPPSSIVQAATSGPARVMVNTAGLKPPPQRPQQVIAPKISTSQLASLSDSSTATLSAILANHPAAGATPASDVNQLEDDSILNKYNPIRPNDYEEFRLERDRRRKVEDEQRRTEAQEAKLRKKAERDEAAGLIAPKHSSSSFSSSKIDLTVSSGEEAYQRRLAASQAAQSGSSSSSSSSAPSAATATTTAAATPKIALAMSGEEAFARRAAMSRSQGAPQQNLAFSAPQTKKQRMDDAPTSELDSIIQTKIVLLRNMVGRGEVDSDLEPEVTDECTKYGKVIACTAINLSVAREPREDHAVRIFVSFADVKSATSAVSAMEGRFFGGRRVSACFVKEDVFARGDLTI